MRDCEPRVSSFVVPDGFLATTAVARIVSQRVQLTHATLVSPSRLDVIERD